MTQLSEAMIICEKHFNTYQDIEWTYDGTNVYILQSRPITTFRNNDFPIVLSNKDKHWYLESIKPYSPIMADIIKKETKAFAKGAYACGYEHHYRFCTFQNGYLYTSQRTIQKCEKIKKRFYDYLNSTHEKNINIYFDVLLPKCDTMIKKLEELDKQMLDSNGLIEYVKLAEKYLTYTSKIHWIAIHGRKFRRIFENYCIEILPELKFSDFNDLIYKKSILTHKRERLMEMAECIRKDNLLYNYFKNCKFNNLLLYAINRITSENANKFNNLLDKYARDYSLFNTGQDSFLPSSYIEDKAFILNEIRPFLDIDIKTYKREVNKRIKKKMK